eukprot:Skav223613  [mRNA]  locus=scaffold1522:80318:81556:- [translate_table: standard]
MRRVYPQVLRAEQAVQELHLEIESAEAETSESRSELNARTYEIQDLRSSLGAVERRKAVRRDAVSTSRAKSRKLEEEVSTARREEERLSEQLQMYLEENQMERKLLDRAAEEKLRLIEETKKNELIIHTTMQHAGGVQLRCLGTSADLENVEKENDGLQNELAGAGFHSMRQRQYLAMEEAEASLQYHNTCEATSANVTSRRQVDGLEQTRRSLEARLKELVEAMHEGDALDVELAKAGEDGTSLKFSLEEMYQRVKTRGENLQKVCGDREGLSKILEESQEQAGLAQEEANQLSAQRDEVQAKCQAEESELTTAQERMLHAESELQNEEQQADVEVQKAKGQKSAAIEKVNQLNQTTSDLKGQLKTLEDATKHLQTRISFFESDTKKIVNENDNLERTIEETKKKINCVIC